MKKQMKKIELLASVLLVGVISATVLGQVGPRPVPIGVSCPGGPVVLSTGVTVTIPPFTCPEGWGCGWAEVFNEENESLGAVKVCLDLS